MLPRISRSFLLSSFILSMATTMALFAAPPAQAQTKGGTLVYSTCIGGAGYDKAYGITVDNSGSAYVTGVTGSNLKIRMELTLSIAVRCLIAFRIPSGMHTIYVTKNVARP